MNYFSPILFFSFIWFLIAEQGNAHKRKTGGRIIGGNVALPAQFAHAAAITVQTADSNFFCCGTLLNTQWIWTAGQCVDGAIMFTIQLGSNTLVSDDPYRVIVATSDYVLHPDYNPSTLDNDLGLIKLREAVELSSYLQPQQFLATFQINDYTNVTAIGWGQTSDQDPQLNNELRWAELSTIPYGECMITYGNQITSNNLCVVGNYNEGTCYGDTGGPLLYDVGRYIVLVGIASFVSGNGCESTDPSGYISITPYINWLGEVTSSN